MKPIRRLIGVLSFAGLAAIVSGCATSQTSADSSTAKAPPPPRAPARWEAVLMPEETAREMGQVDWAWWDERRDGVLAMRSNEPMLATNQWPEASRPTLDRARYIYLPRRSDTILYFQPE